MNKRLLLYIFLLSFVVSSVEAYDYVGLQPSDTTLLQVNKKERPKTFFQKLLTPFKWIGKNWSAYDPRYSTPSFYNWAGHIQNTTSAEWLSIHALSDGVSMYDIRMRSKVSNKIGPYFGYQWLFYGSGIDLFALKGTKGRSEFTLSINSNLFNIDIIRRRTGGDFLVRKFEGSTFMDVDGVLSNHYHVGDNIRYGINGFNINYFTNHKKYSNPAAFSNGAIQLRSVGSPIIGIGYTHHKIENTLGNLAADVAANKMGVTVDDKQDTWDDLYENNPLGFLNMLVIVPSTLRTDDVHLQLGYAYNFAFSRRLLLGISAIISPGYKHTSYDNYNTYTVRYAKQITTAFNNDLVHSLMEEEGVSEDEAIALLKADDLYFDADILRDQDSFKSFGLDLFVRASLVYNLNRWRVGVNANANNFFLVRKRDGIDYRLNSNYGSVTTYVGYCFGRKKEYRWNGKNREAYIKAALTKSQIAEIKDTMPAGNVKNTMDYVAKSDAKTKYRNDIFNFNIYGCDLVKGPDGRYGYFEIEDGYVTPGQDEEGRVSAGKVLEMDKEGNLHVNVGHSASIRAGNWWKSQLDVRQTPMNWYPELLHYALKGRLTFYVRSYTFGTKEPVKVVIDNFYLNHGKESKQFYQIGAKDFWSHSSYSIVGNVAVNQRLCRVYIESKKRGTQINVYVNRLKASGLNWMSMIPDNRPISRVSIPGTHDSGTASLPENTTTSMGHTQNFTVTEQLYDGIRAFDIRLKKNMKYGHTMICRDGFDESMVDIAKFLKDNPSEFIVALIGSDEGGKWDGEMQQNYKALIAKYPDLFIEKFSPATSVKDVRGKILVIRRQEACPFGKLLEFEDNNTFEYDCFRVEDEYKEHKTYKKIKIVAKHLREAYENDDPDKWYITFNSIAWDPRHHKPYYSAWGAINVRKPMNPSLREVIESKGYNNFGIVFLDFYSDHGDRPQLVSSIIDSNFSVNNELDFIPAFDN